MLYYVFALLVTLVDQLTKWAVVKYMSLSETIPLIEGVFHITSHRNFGAAFGILQNQRWFLILVSLLVVIGIVYYMKKMGKFTFLKKVALSLILGGALGNLIDRVIKGEVVDMLDFRWMNYPIFNTADAAIVVGVMLLLIVMFLEERKSKIAPEQDPSLLIQNVF